MNNFLLQISNLQILQKTIRPVLTIRAILALKSKPILEEIGYGIIITLDLNQN